MQRQAQPLLSNLPLFHSSDEEETRAFLEGKAFAFDVADGSNAALDVKINGAYTPGCYIGYIEYGKAAVDLSPGPDHTEYWIHLPVRGRLEATVGGETVNCNEEIAVVASPSRETCRLKSSPGSARIQIALSKASMIERLIVLLGDIPEREPEFSPAVDLRTGYGRSLAEHIDFAVHDLNRCGSVLANPQAIAVYEDFIATAMLLSHPHSYSEALAKGGKSIAPYGVKRAVDYIEANLGLPITLSDIVTASGVPGRTLFKHFAEFKGLSPMAYLRLARFRKARRALLKAEPGTSITELAMSCGFSHLGRFSVEYRRRFGETPSETLTRNRRFSWPGARQPA